MSFVWRKRLFLLLFPVLLATSVFSIHIETDLNAFFTATDDADSRLLSGLLKSGELSRRYLLVVENSTNAQDRLPDINEFSTRLIKQLAQIKDLEQVWSASSPPEEWLDAIVFYAPFHARIYSLNPALEAQDLFTPTALSARAQALKNALLSPQGGFVKSIAKHDPLLLSLNGFKNLQQQFQLQTSLNASGGALILQSRPAALDSKAHIALQMAIKNSFDTLNQTEGNRFKLSMAGIPVISEAAHSEISRDVTLVSVVSSVLVVVVFLLLFHSFSALHWVMMVQAASFVLGTLATALIFGEVHSLTLALGASLIGICTDYPIHVMVHCSKHQHTPLTAVRLLWPSLVMGGLTTIIGYAALGFTGFPGFEQIAVFALFSISASLALTRWVLPGLLEHSRIHIAHLPGIANWVKFCAQHRTVLLVLFGFAIIVSVFSLPQLRWMDDMQKLAMDMTLLKKQDAAVRAHFSSIEPGRFVLVQADDMETALIRSEAVERRLNTLKSGGIVSEYHGLFPWLTSLHLQQENAKAYDQALTPEFRETWRSQLIKAGLAADKLGTLSMAETQPLYPAAVLATAVKHILSGQMLATENGVALSIWLGNHDPEKLTEALAGMEGVRYFSQKDQLDRLAKQYRDRSLVMLAMGVLIMGLFIWLQQRDVKRMLLTLLPSLGAIVFIFAVWALIGEEVSFLHVIGLLLSVSLCVDYGIFFMDNRGQDSDVTYHALAASTLTTLASFGALGLGKTPTLPILALSVCLGVTLGFLLCPLLIHQQDKPCP